MAAIGVAAACEMFLAIAPVQPDKFGSVVIHACYHRFAIVCRWGIWRDAILLTSIWSSSGLHARCLSASSSPHRMPPAKF